MLQCVPHAERRGIWTWGSVCAAKVLGFWCDIFDVVILAGADDDTLSGGLLT